MQKFLNARAALLAGMSAIVLGGTPSLATPVNWGAIKAPADIIVPEPAKKPKTTNLARLRALEPPVAEVSVVDTKPAQDSLAAGSKKSKRAKKKTAEDKADKTPSTVPPGQLHIIVSIDAQRATLYSNGLPVASTKVSTGTQSHPTPMGVFSVIQKNRHHISNLYNTPMPYMQRLTWSGTAMHTGALPGYPASHGCIRLPNEFAQMLWKATKIGARVIVTREEVKPVEFSSARLLMPKPQVAVLPTAKPETTGTLVRTADATSQVSGAVVQDAERPADAPANPAGTAAPAPDAEPAIDPRVTVVEAVASSKEIERRNSPVSVFVSRKDGKLYVRQAMQPLFNLPVKLRDPEQPIGTHVYTAMELNGGEMRWTSVTIPSGFRSDTSETKSSKKFAKWETPAKPTLPPSNAAAALERFDMPQEAIDRIGAMLIPGSSLIVSDNGIAGETGSYTDFIVLTR